MTSPHSPQPAALPPAAETARRTSPETRPSRRGILSLGAGLLGIGALGACSVSTGTPGDVPAAQTPLSIDIPDPATPLPEAAATIGWMDNGNLKGPFIQAFHAAYQKKHPQVTIDYTEAKWATINESIPLAIRNGSAPDVFLLPNTVPRQVAVAEGWIAPLDDVVPGFAQWKEQLGEDVFIPGVEVFDGKTYTFPLSVSNGLNPTMFFDVQRMEEAGVDPVGERLTWSGLRKVAADITRAGAGEYYGLLIGKDQLSSFTSALAILAGAGTVGGMDYRSGQYAYESDEMVAAFELMLAMRDDGSLFPDYMSLTEATAAPRLAQRAAGMFFTGPYYIPQWQKDSPDFDFGVAAPPTGDDGAVHHVGYQPFGTDHLFLSADSAHPEIVGDMFAYIGSVEGQANLVAGSGGILMSVIDEANTLAEERGDISEQGIAARSHANELMRIAPIPQTRNPQIAQVVMEMKAVKPALSDIAIGIMSGQISDIRTALRDLDSASEQALDDAIAAARAKGAEVSREDYVFPTWDPSVDFGIADYEADA
ncbi:ABC transporter substrate-binding protein [Brachybacterium hainanense]|uniref:ABC transporter substrate-binding protein n=1 Tax=Brachybacterium hainanense TaxID=1541174 RepID=A0ABV6RBS1_9MICO